MGTVVTVLDWIGIFLLHNALAVIAVALYVTANVIPRPDPDACTPGWRTFWRVVDRASFLTSEALPGNLKRIGQLSPIVVDAKPDGSQAQEAVVAEAQAAHNVGEEKKS
jgi:hypothetical protein